MKKAQKGFTLVELIVVIAIIGILAAILVPSMMGYVKKSKLKSANSNAKLVFTTINGAASDVIADNGDLGKIKASSAYGGSNNYVDVKADLSGLDAASEPLGAAVYKALSDNGDGAGFAYWTINASTNNVNLAQWSSSASSKEIVGQYPGPLTNPDATNKIGTGITN